jgi:hypothetical protein
MTSPGLLGQAAGCCAIALRDREDFKKLLAELAADAATEK